MRTVTPLAALVAALAACSTSPTDEGSVLVTPPAVIAVAPRVAALELGSSLRLTATAPGLAALQGTPTDLVWRSSNTSIAIVGAGGLVQAIGVGAVRIVVSWRGYSGVSLVTVRAALGDAAPCTSGSAGKRSIVEAAAEPRHGERCRPTR
jgi:hypothetical protein